MKTKPNINYTDKTLSNLEKFLGSSCLLLIIATVTTVVKFNHHVEDYREYKNDQKEKIEKLETSLSDCNGLIVDMRLKLEGIVVKVGTLGEDKDQVRFILPSSETSSQVVKFKDVGIDVVEKK